MAMNRDRLESTWPPDGRLPEAARGRAQTAPTDARRPDLRRTNSLSSEGSDRKGGSGRSLSSEGKPGGHKPGGHKSTEANRKAEKEQLRVLMVQYEDLMTQYSDWEEDRPQMRTCGLGELRDKQKCASLQDRS
jgi:hypothetical protein